MGQVTGIPLGVAVGLLGGRAPGVFAPEMLLEPKELFAALAPHCLGHPTPEEMTVTTRSWDPEAGPLLQDALRRARAAVVG